MFLDPSGFGAFGITYRPRCLWDIGGSVVVVRPFRAGVCSMCSFVHADVTLGSAVVLPAKGSTRLQSCVLHKRKYVAAENRIRITDNYKVRLMTNK